MPDPHLTNPDFYARNYDISDQMNGYGADNWEPPSVSETDIMHPPPAKAFVFIHQSNWNASPDFTIQVVDSEWVNIPEAVHMQGDNLSFADGHCEHWTWFERNTLQLQQTIYSQTAGGTSTTIALAGSLNVVPGDKDFARVSGAYSTPLSGRGEF